MADDLTPVDPSSLPPAVRAAAAAAMGGKTPSWWERNVLPLRQPVEKALAYWPPGTPDFIKRLGTPGMAQGLAEQIVPDTATDAALNAAMLAMPEGEALEALPPPVRALLKSRLGRIGTMTGVGAGLGAATGEGAGKGAKKGALGQAGGELIGTVGRRVTEGNEATRYAVNLGQKIRENYPVLDAALERAGQGLKTAKDFLVFKGGERSVAMKHVSDILSEMKEMVTNAVGTRRPMAPGPAFIDLIRDNPREWAEMRIMGGRRPLTFSRMDEFLSRVRAKAYKLSSGTGKDSALGARIRRNADRALDDLAGQLDQMAPGVGKLYRQAQGDWAEANQLARMFSEKGVIEGDKIVPEELQKLGMEAGQAGYFTELNRTPAGQAASRQIYRGAPATGTDQPRLGVSIYGEMWPLPIHVRSHVNPFGTKRVGSEAVKLYHGIPAIVAKALAERTGAFGDAE